jgi:uncharacterized membrane protein (DUF441 family)
MTGPRQWAKRVSCAWTGTAGLAGGFLQVSQRIAATIATAAVTGVVLGGTGLGGVTAGLLICAGLLAASTGCAALDLRTPARPAPATVTAGA